VKRTVRGFSEQNSDMTANPAGFSRCLTFYDAKLYSLFAAL
jgi:hypothetical protein